MGEKGKNMGFMGRVAIKRKGRDGGSGGNGRRKGYNKREREEGSAMKMESGRGWGWAYTEAWVKKKGLEEKKGDGA
ncbi:hypothetical protein ACH5RR_028741 [Cinchona calisaya]|uniref:Uncharacterized protein n=1 Tax=Cinchona calisaya TaxID=153742 RepID=A0ABD2YT95_9GENT